MREVFKVTDKTRKGTVLDIQKENVFNTDDINKRNVHIAMEVMISLNTDHCLSILWNVC